MVVILGKTGLPAYIRGILRRAIRNMGKPPANILFEIGSR